MILPKTSASSRKPAWGLWLILTGFYAYFIIKNRNFELDDALIYLRYIQNALSGHGLVYNDGVRFNGLTSPLFSYLVLGAGWLLNNAQLASFLISSAMLFLAAIVMARLFEGPISDAGIFAPRIFAWLGALLLLFSPYFYLTFGMETGLYTLLSAALILLMKERIYHFAGIGAALLFLTRSEGVFLIIAVGLFDLIRTRRLPPFSVLTYVAPVLIVAGVFMFNYFYYGAVLPQTGMAKIWQGESGLWGDDLIFLHVDYFFSFVFGSSTLTLATYAVFTSIGLVAVRDRYVVGVTICYLAVYSLFYIILNIPNYHWYYSPFFAFAPYFAASGLGCVLTAMRRWQPGVRGWLLMGIIAVPMAVLLAVNFRLNSAARSGIDAYQKIGKWMKANLKSDAAVAMVEIGTVGYYSELNIVDLLGLVNPDNAKFVGERRFDAWLQEYKVTNFLVHDPLWDHEISLLGAGVARLVTEDCSFDFPGYRLYRVAEGGPGIQACDPSKNYFVAGKVAANSPVGLEPERGRIDEARVVGNFLKVYGWARDPGNTSFGTLEYRGPADGRLIWQRMPRVDVAAAFSEPKLKDSGFSGAIRFDTYEQARAALGAGCLLVQDSDGSVPALLSLTPGSSCR